MWSSALLLHGHGGDPDTVVALAAPLIDAAGTNVARPAGPVRLPGGGRAWWPDDAGGPDEEARSTIAALAAGARPLVCGFSQGAAMALVSAPPHATVVSVAGFLPPEATMPAGDGPLLVVHAEHDDAVDPMHAALVSRRAERVGRPVTTVMLPGGHAWSDHVTAAVVQWLSSLRTGARCDDGGGGGAGA